MVFILLSNYSSKVKARRGAACGRPDAAAFWQTPLEEKAFG